MNVAKYKLPSGEIITFHYEDPYDSIHCKGEDITFQLKTGLVVMAQRLPSTLTFEARIKEKAENWTFDVKLKADNEVEARMKLAKMFPRKQYFIVEVNPSN